MTHIKRRMQEGNPKVNYFLQDAKGILWFKDMLVKPKKEALKKRFRYSIHPREYQDVSRLKAAILVDMNEV
jgi:hypothetical protein